MDRAKAWASHLAWTLQKKTHPLASLWERGGEVILEVWPGKRQVRRVLPFPKRRVRVTELLLLLWTPYWEARVKWDESGFIISEDDLLNSEQVIHVVYHDQLDVSTKHLVQASSEQHCKLQPSALSHQCSPSCANSSEANLLLKPFQFLSSPFQFPSSAILIACATAGSILLILMISLVWKRKYNNRIS